MEGLCTKQDLYEIQAVAGKHSLTSQQSMKRLKRLGRMVAVGQEIARKTIH